MNKNRLFLSVVSVAAAFALLATGCAVDGGKTGSIAFSFGSAARALGEGESYRVEIYYGSDLYPAEPTEDGDTLTFSALPTGRATVYVAQGTGTGDGFVAAKTGKAEVTIVPGDGNTASVTLEDVLFHLADGVGSVTSVVALGTGIYVADSDGLKTARYDGTGTFTVADGPEIPAGVTDVSLSVAKYFDEGSGFEDQVWVNGSWVAGGAGGIMPWTEEGLEEGFAAGLDATALTVTGSGAYGIPAEGEDEDALVLFYRYADGIGGLYIERSEIGAAYAEWSWLTIDLRDTLGDLIGAGQEPVLDFAVAGNSLYLVTAFTTLKISGGALEAGITSADDLLDSDYVGFATGVPASITSIAVYEGTGAFANVGTATGLWRGLTSTATTTFFDGDPTTVDGTSGYAIRKIAISPDGEHVAFISDRGEGTADFLVVKVAAATESTTYRAIEGVPGTRLTSLAWLDDDTLLVGGNAGLAALDVAD